MIVRAAIVLSVALAGCASTDQAVRAKPADGCSIVAEQRMRDGALNGYDEKLQKFTYAHTYKDCVKWNLSHGVNF